MTMRTVLNVKFAAIVAMTIALCAGCEEKNVIYKGAIADVLYELYDLGNVGLAEGVMEVVSTPKEGDLPVGSYVLFKSIEHESNFCVGDTICFSIVTSRGCSERVLDNILVERFVEIEIFK